MVVCKCRKATKLYCFVHKVPLCLDCICSSEHHHCVVGQYSDWVNDGDYDWPPKCAVCDESLEASTKPTTRLGCLHVLHSECVKSHLESFPAHTAPAGYTCPACPAAVWPPRNQRDAATTLYTNLRALISTSSVAEALLKAPIAQCFPERGTPSGFATPPLALSSREPSSDDLRTLHASSLGNNTAAVTAPSSSDGKSEFADVKPKPNGLSSPSERQQQGGVQQQVAVARSRASGAGVSSGGVGMAGGASIVAVDVAEDLSKDALHGYGADDDDVEQKYARRGPAHVQFVRYLGSMWSPALRALPLSAAPHRKDKDDYDDAAEPRLRRGRSSKGKAAMDPRRMLLLVAIGSCMATMLLLYYRLVQGGVPGTATTLP